ncbi:MAG TPA: sulfite reductase subunit alpha, partial [Xanthobacteraceae bacterium]|nr:sulfite reductase subunit alpha [Xanthobacteraceae bacterium]
VASTFLAERVSPQSKIKGYVQKAHDFALPADPTRPIIMIGPGTGIAPFRAFLHERMATKAPGRNWLFFGHQRSDYDFFYQDELAGLKAKGALNRLTLAWSRDSGNKIYVQDRMREVGRDLWTWLADGAHVYVCGDARRMAKDVERALVDVVATFGARSTDEAISFVGNLRKTGRYQTDVY